MAKSKASTKISSTAKPAKTRKDFPLRVPKTTELQENLSSEEISNYTAYIDPYKKKGAVTLQVPSGPILLSDLTNVEVASLVTLLSSGPTFWNGYTIAKN